MLFKFQSKIAGDLIMLEPHGRRLLDIIGKDPNQAGIILPAQIPATLSALENAIQAEDAAIELAKRKANKPPANPSRADNSANSDSDSATASDVIPLRQRSLPFIDLLKKCLQADAQIVWGV